MNLKELSKSKAARELIKEMLEDQKGHLANELKEYVQTRAIEEEIVKKKEEITPGVFSRACQDTLEKELGRYVRDENGFYRKVSGEFSIIENLEGRISLGVSKVLKDTVKRLEREVNKKPQLKLSTEDFECIQNVKSILEFLNEKIEIIDKMNS